MIGTTLSHYKIISKLGQGGMGEVYLAEDSRLDRKVALKILPQHLSDRAELRERFEREARAVSSLNHPHICTLYDIGEQDGIHYLVMEHLVGETLEARLAKGPLPLEQTLEYAIQIADALDKAHRQGVVHRDLKPGNIMLVKSGAKLLDFGLAKLQAADTPTNLSALPTEQANLTAEGTILGTLQYMAPEQLEAKEADSRTDIFAFGAVVYEMATGKKAFEGKSQASLIGAILKDHPPPMSDLQPMTPALLEQVVRKCLEKEPDERWQSASDLMTGLRWVTEVGTSVDSLPAIAAPAVWKRAMPWSLAAVMALIVGFMFWNPSPTAPTTSTSTPQPVIRFVAALPADLRVGDIGFGIVALSRDGTRLAYVATRGGATQLYLRSMDQLEAKPLPGTEDASYPFFSPDGQWLGFFAGSKLRKVSVNGGAPVVICDVYSPFFTANWGRDDIIRFSAPGSPIRQVPAAGGTPEAVTKLDSDLGETGHSLPQLLPDGNTFLFNVYSAQETWVVVQSLETGERKVVLEGIGDARYVPSGHLVYGQAGTLMAVAFDLEQLQAKGNATPILQGVMQGGARGEMAHMAFSDTGTLVYIPSRDDPRQDSTLVWVDRQGRVESLAAPGRSYFQARLSPDGQRVVVYIEGDLWLYDNPRDNLSRFTFQGGSFPLWTPDGKRITFQSARLGGTSKMFWKAADGTGVAEQLSEGELPQTPHSWSPDGKWLAFSERSPASNSDIWVLSLEEERQPQAFLQTPGNETGIVFSPDGRWLAYRSNESGREEIYVQPFPSTGAKWQISTEGGEEAAWMRSGELFYRNGDKMMAVDITTDPTFAAGTPKLLFEGVYYSYGPRAAYDVTPDGQKFLMIKTGEQQVTELNVIQNWFEELKRLVPTDN